VGVTVESSVEKIRNALALSDDLGASRAGSVAPGDGRAFAPHAPNRSATRDGTTAGLLIAAVLQKLLPRLIALERFDFELALTA